jgi:hypothetical protein
MGPFIVANDVKIAIDPILFILRTKEWTHLPTK